MKPKYIKIIAALACLVMAAQPAGAKDFKDGVWKVSFDKKTKTLSYRQDGQTIVDGAYACAEYRDSLLLDSRDYPKVKFSKTKVADPFGRGTRYTYLFTGLAGRPDLEHNIYIYPSRPYMQVETAVVGTDRPVSVDKICPIVSATPTTLPLPGEGNRIYDMPWANDNWATFNTWAWDEKPRVESCEATAMFNVGTRKALVIGSIDHSTWKSAIALTPSEGNRIDTLAVTAGYVSPRTWDVVNGQASSQRHGAVRGQRVASPRTAIGLFDDWRSGLETYGEANTVLCPRMEWTRDESLFGWQSWGGMEFGLNYESAMSVLDYFEKELLPKGFHNKQGRCHMVLDSGWSALCDEQLKAYADKCKSLGIVPGIYTTPFSYWGSEQDFANPDRMWEGGRLNDMVVRANGRPRKINGFSLDPTHPAVKEWNRRNFEKFRNLGFEFVKIDFMNNGSQEADSYYLPEITTGLQAFNYGMDYIVEFAGDMMLDYSIAPIFPAKAHARRIGCDAWGDLPQSMYTLNCIDGSWWLDRVYAFNDPDHMCLSKVQFSGKGSNDEQEARIRFTSGLMTGMTLLGGTYAYQGPERRLYGKDVHMVGYDEERQRAAKFASNADLIAMGRIGRTFRPVEGVFDNLATLFSTDDVSVDNEFILDNGDEFYYVVFNYDSGKPLTKAPDYGRLGIDAGSYKSVKELWTGEVTTPAELAVSVPAKDVRVYRLSR